ALAVVLALLVAFFIAAGPLSTFQPGRIDAFVPAYGTAVFVNDLITAVLLFAQFSILRSRALLAIASGYLYTALIVIPWVLTFPGVFTPGGLLGAGLQSTDWLFNLWHAGFPTFVIAYTLLKDADPTKGLWRGSAGAAILSSVAVTAAVVCAVTVLVTAGQAHLPRTMLDPVRFSTLKLYVVGCLILWNALALILLWIRRCSVLDLWLMVVFCAYVLEIYTGALGLARFSAGWYASRFLGFVPSILVLCVLLYEITTLYAQLLRSVLAQRREREARLMTGDAVSASMAHEIKQPLSAMTMNANAGLRWLDRAAPDLDAAKAALRRIVTNGHRAGAVIENIRALFKPDARTRTSLDVNNLIREALTLVRDDLQRHRIAVQADCNEWFHGTFLTSYRWRRKTCWPMPNGVPSIGALERKESSRLVLLLSACGSPTDRRSGSGTRVSTLPGDEAWLIGEHRMSGEKKYYLANLPANTDLRTLAATVKARWICEQAHQQMKEELGLDHFEGRSWHGLHRHALMTM